MKITLLVLSVILFSCTNPTESEERIATTEKSDYLFTNLLYYVNKGSNIGNITLLQNYVVVGITTMQADSIVKSNSREGGNAYRKVCYKRLN